MNISKIQLKAKGFKGLYVEYTEEETRSVKPDLTPKSIEPKNPIHYHLDRMFRDLKLHILNLCEVINDSMLEPDILFHASETEIKEIEIKGDAIKLKGVKRRFDGKFNELKPCWVQFEDNYEGWDLLVTLVKNILKETEDYLCCRTQADIVEVAIRWVEASKTQDISVEEIKSWPEEKQKEWASQLIASDYGNTKVFSDIDIDPCDDGTIEPVKDEFEVSMEGETEIEVPKKEKGKRGRKKKEVATVADESTENTPFGTTVHEGKAVTEFSHTETTVVPELPKVTAQASQPNEEEVF